MRRQLWLVCAVALLAGLESSNGFAQGWRRSVYIEPNDPPATEFIAARWRFGTNGLIGHTGWSHNYPNSEQNLNQFVSEATRVDVARLSYRLLELSSDEIFEYPFTYISEPGEMALTDAEVVHFREYVERGGFVLIDDFDGPVHIDNLRREMRRVFPDRDLILLTATDPIFRLHYDVDSLESMEPYVSGGRPVYYGLLNERGELAIVACHNNDLANFWDWVDSPSYPFKPGADAFRIGINFVLHSMTR